MRKAEIIRKIKEVEFWWRTHDVGTMHQYSECVFCDAGLSTYRDSPDSIKHKDGCLWKWAHEQS